MLNSDFDSLELFDAHYQYSCTYLLKGGDVTVLDSLYHKNMRIEFVINICLICEIMVV